MSTYGAINSEEELRNSLFPSQAGYQDDYISPSKLPSNVQSKSTYKTIFLLVSFSLAFSAISYLSFRQNMPQKQLRLFSDLSEVAKKKLFHDFMEKFRKSYETAQEYNDRYNQFLINLRTYDERNIKECRVLCDALHGITKFSDLAEEFISNQIRGFLHPATPLHTVDIHKKYYQVLKIGSKTLSDWRGIYTNPVGSQGRCGCCWAFSAVEQLESDIMRTYNVKDIHLSVQQVVDCDDQDMGCDGGIPFHAWTYIYESGGLAYDVMYPYISGNNDKSGTCHQPQNENMTAIQISENNNVKYSLSNYITFNDEIELAGYVLHVGPVSVCVDSSTWTSYVGGVMTNATCSSDPDKADHCVQAVGLNLNAQPSYWIVRFNKLYMSNLI